MRFLKIKALKSSAEQEQKNVEADTLYYEKEDDRFSIEQTKILLAIGRRPNIETLNLEKANVEVTDRGLLKVINIITQQQTISGLWVM